MTVENRRKTKYLFRYSDMILTTV